MASSEKTQSWTCAEAGCDYTAFASAEDVIISAAMDHIRVVHSSFELEEVILAALCEVAADGVPPEYVTIDGLLVSPDWAKEHTSAAREHRKHSMEWSPARGLD